MANNIISESKPVVDPQDAAATGAFNSLQSRVATAHQGQTQPVSAQIATALQQPTNEFSKTPYSAARAARLQ